MDTQAIIEAPDLSKLLTSADSGLWVALAPDYSAVLARAESVEALLKTLSKDEQAQNPVFYKVPTKDTYYIPFTA